MNRLEELVAELVAEAPRRPDVHALRSRTRRRRVTRVATALLAVTAATAGIVAIARSVGDKRSGPAVVISPPTSVPGTTSGSDPSSTRGAAANVGYVERLVAEKRLPHASMVTKVAAVADRIVVSTTLANTTQAAELWEGLSLALGCDDSFLLIKGYSVVLADGTHVDQPRPGFQYCVDANRPALEVPTGTTLCRAAELEVAPNPTLALIRLFNRSGRPCGLAGFVSVYGRVAAGPWRAVKSVPLGTTVTNGPRWTGVFEPNLTAVISIEPVPAADCVANSAPTHFTGLRLALPHDVGTIDIDTIQFEVTNYPLAVSPVEADSQDN